jgi:hypothetical protein
MRPGTNIWKEKYGPALAVLNSRSTNEQISDAITRYSPIHAKLNV